jgi:hypothetical protein
MLPNPTFSNWDSKAFNLSGLLAAFKKHVQKPETSNEREPYINEITALCNSIEARRQASLNESYEFLDELHQTIDKLDESLCENRKHIIKIVRRHVDGVMSKLNSNKGDKLLKLLDEGSPERKVDALMQIYFEPVREAVRSSTQEHGDEAQEQSGEVQEQSDEAASTTAAADQMTQGSSSLLQSTPRMQQLTTSVADEIWCRLVLRMLCWLMLHDFNKRDVQLYDSPKSELLGSRLPVYII